MVLGPEPVAGTVRFAEAIEFLRRRLSITSDEWRAIWGGSGIAAKAATDKMAEAVMRDLLAAVLQIIESGGTLEDFRREYRRILSEAGWSTPGDPGWHSQLVFRLHTQSAYSAGRWEQAQRLQAAAPNWQLYGRYVTAEDNRVRETHRQWHGIVLPIDHPFWRTHWPLNGFNCRCHVMLVRDIDLRRYGWTVTPNDDPRLLIPPDAGWSGNVGITGLNLMERA
ncbi:phage putative head morphogenesis protein, SPP1 gp7 family [Devosia enhydra]|uniref:Phage putative head morphogenesis protein, SPP1 gp7 family n=1 Tax=Devosia enhydra TaxID=665118 RepID=A0A1K2I0Z0_9HYPH|nr:phage minor head protein [Devosia enhydra]SFZ85993.1 phage putative head morphogenesis protein, SPP1 gp7 family [Devosia enhydra]